MLCPGLPTGGVRLWSSSFLPASYQGIHIRNDAEEPSELLQDIQNKFITKPEQQRQLELLDKMNKSYLDRVRISAATRSRDRVDGSRFSDADRSARRV